MLKSIHLGIGFPVKRASQAPKPGQPSAGELLGTGEPPSSEVCSVISMEAPKIQHNVQCIIAIS